MRGLSGADSEEFRRDAVRVEKRHLAQQFDRPPLHAIDAQLLVNTRPTTRYHRARPQGFPSLPPTLPLSLPSHAQAFSVL